MSDLVKDVGLVLAGGGAKGAYQAGAVRALAEVGCTVMAVAGTSIGALNGAVVASSTSLEQAADALHAAWGRLAREEVVRLGPGGALRVAGWAATLLAPGALGKLTGLLARHQLISRNAILDTGPMERLIRDLINPPDLRSGLPMYATVCPVHTLVPRVQVLELLAAWLLSDPDYIHLNPVTPDELMLDVLLSSAAVPFAFGVRDSDLGRNFDGGVLDNHPVQALKQHGVRRLVVVHLGNGVRLDRAHHPELELIEIRPREAIQDTDLPGWGWAKALLDFSPERIQELQTRGYQDALAVLEPIVRTESVVRSRRDASSRLEAAMEDLDLDPI